MTQLTWEEMVNQANKDCGVPIRNHSIVRAKVPERQPDFQWDTQVCGVERTVDIFCSYCKGDRGDIYNPPEAKGYQVEYCKIGDDKLYDPKILEACQKYVDECV